MLPKQGTNRDDATRISKLDVHDTNWTYLFDHFEGDVYNAATPVRAIKITNLVWTTSQCSNRHGWKRNYLFNPNLTIKLNGPTIFDQQTKNKNETYPQQVSLETNISAKVKMPQKHGRSKMEATCGSQH